MHKSFVVGALFLYFHFNNFQEADPYARTPIVRAMILSMPILAFDFDQPNETNVNELFVLPNYTDTFAFCFTHSAKIVSRSIASITIASPYTNTGQLQSKKNLSKKV